MAVFMIGAVGKQGSETESHTHKPQRPAAKPEARRDLAQPTTWPHAVQTAHAPRRGHDLGTARVQRKRRARHDGALGRRKSSSRAPPSRRAWAVKPSYPSLLLSRAVW